MDQNLTPEEQAIYSQIIAPAFYEKCAARGRQLSPSEIEVHLENAAMIQQAKQAADSSTARQTNALLKAELGYTAASEKQADDKSVKTAAAAILANPELAKLLK